MCDGLTGLLRELAIWNTALSSQQVNCLFSEGLDYVSEEAKSERRQRALTIDYLLSAPEAEKKEEKKEEKEKDEKKEKGKEGGQQKGKRDSKPGAKEEKKEANKESEEKEKSKEEEERKKKEEEEKKQERGPSRLLRVRGYSCSCTFHTLLFSGFQLLSISLSQSGWNRHPPLVGHLALYHFILHTYFVSTTSPFSSICNLPFTHISLASLLFVVLFTPNLPPSILQFSPNWKDRSPALPRTVSPRSASPMAQAKSPCPFPSSRPSPPRRTTPSSWTRGTPTRQTRS